MVYLKSVENVITLGKLIGLLFLFCLPLLSILFLKTKRNDLARPVMGTIFLVLNVFVLFLLFLCEFSTDSEIHFFSTCFFFQGPLHPIVQTDYNGKDL